MPNLIPLPLSPAWRGALDAMAMPTDTRDAIARARHHCGIEISHTRAAVRYLAARAKRPAELAQLAGHVERLRLLLEHVERLERLAKAALQAQVDVDPDMAGATVGDDGRITQPCTCPLTACPRHGARRGI